MAFSAQKIENRLLAHHLFPRIAKRGDEFPPCFVSRGLSSGLASKLIAIQADREDGYGVVALRSTRYDLAPRNMEVLHPRAFAKVVRQLRVSWDDWKAIESNLLSALRLAEHADGRVFSMVESKDAEELVTPGSRFRAKVDITNFYGSIYTHAIPWAVHGVEKAKSKRDDGADWANRLDSEMRQARRKETTGISIGPGTSAIVGEIMLSAVDERLRVANFEFLRFIDDYYYIANSRNEAEEFVRAVREELAALKLSIHPGKTKITELPTPLRPSWMRELRLTLRGSNTVGTLLDLLDQAIESHGDVDEDGSLRYALVTVEEALRADEADAEDRLVVIDRILSIGFLRPVAIGAACRLLEIAGNAAIQARADVLNRTLREHTGNRRTDAATWLLFILLGNSAVVDGDSVRDIVQSGDCMTIALLTCGQTYVPAVATFIAKFEKRQPPAYMRDEYWLVYYQLALAGKVLEGIPKSYYDEFQPLLDAGVTFIDLNVQNSYLPTHDKPRRGPATGGSVGNGRNPYAR